MKTLVTAKNYYRHKKTGRILLVLTIFDHYTQGEVVKMCHVSVRKSGKRYVSYSTIEKEYEAITWEVAHNVSAS